jgi:hypothetical protein
MWLLVQVARGSKYFDPDTRVDNRVLICDSSDLAISGRASGDGAYRFEARRGTENFSVAEFKGLAAGASLNAEFNALAQRLDAVGAPPRA